MNVFTRAILSLLTAAAMAGVCSSAWSQEDQTASLDSAAAAVAEDLAQWQYFAGIEGPAAEGATANPESGKLVDFFVPGEVFAHARGDLGDLRLLMANGAPLPFAVRTLLPQSVRDTVYTTEFNRSEPDEGLHELTLELQLEQVEHNEVVVETSGDNYRRTVNVSGSDDAKDWKPLVSGQVVRFNDGKQLFASHSLTYPNSRHKYIRIQVTPDPDALSAKDGKDEFVFSEVQVVRQLTLPGTRVKTDAKISDREPTRHYGTAASRWIFDLGASVPCDRLEIDVQDEDFARDVTLEMETVNVLGQPAFVPVYLDEESPWQRRKGDPVVPMVIKFQEVQARRLRLTVTDHRNKPLTLTAARGQAAARQVVFERPEESQLPLKLYFGNLSAENPNYDFARNLTEPLPEELPRVKLAAVEKNPEYIAPPEAFTERFPWLIYVVLGGVAVALGAVILNLSRAAIANHDSAATITAGS